MSDTVTVTEGVIYDTIDDIDLRLDYAVPDTSRGNGGSVSRPIVLYIHGGAWLSGIRDGEGERFILRRMAAAGFVAASTSYRFSSAATFPAQIHDVWAAVRWLRVHADELGANPDRVGAWGHSAGGHLAALLGLTAGRTELGADSEPLTAIVPISAPTDLSKMPEADNPGSHESLLLGATVAESRELADQASPITYARAAGTAGSAGAAAAGAERVAGRSEGPAFLIIHGKDDELVPFAQAEEFHEALPGSSLFAVGGADHSFTRGSVGWPEIIAVAGAFFQTTLCR